MANVTGLGGSDTQMARGWPRGATEVDSEELGGRRRELARDPREPLLPPPPSAARELGRLRQLRSLSLSLAQACSVEDLVDVLATRVAGDCGAETAVVYLMDPDQENVLRLAAARGLDSSRLDPGLLCRDGGALIARAVHRREPLLETEHAAPGALATVVACPLLLRSDPVGAFAFGWSGPFMLDSANHEYLLGASALVALALDRTAATEKAREAQRVSDYMTTLVGRIFGGQQTTPA